MLCAHAFDPAQRIIEPAVRAFDGERPRVQGDRVAKSRGTLLQAGNGARIRPVLLVGGKEACPFQVVIRLRGRKAIDGPGDRRDGSVALARGGKRPRLDQSCRTVSGSRGEEPVDDCQRFGGLVAVEFELRAADVDRLERGIQFPGTAVVGKGILPVPMQPVKLGPARVVACDSGSLGDLCGKSTDLILQILMRSGR